MSFYLPRKEKKQLMVVVFAVIALLVGITLCIAFASIVRLSKNDTKTIDEFIADIKNYPKEDVLGVLEKLRALYSQCSWMSNLDAAEDIVIEKMKKEIENRYKKFDYSEKSYQSLQKLAEEICATGRVRKGGQFKKSSLYSFSDSFVQLMALAQDGKCNLFINKIEVSSSYKEGACIEDCSCWVNSNKPIRLVAEGKNSSHVFKNSTTLPGMPSSVSAIACKPWNQFTISMHVWEYDKGIFSDWNDKERQTQSFVPARKYVPANGNNGVAKEFEVTGHVKMKIFYSLSYKTLDELYSMYLMEN